MIVKMLPEVLESRGGSPRFMPKAELELEELEKRCKAYADKWESNIVDCSNGVNFEFTEDKQIKYKGEDGYDHTADITQDAFNQLCSRISKGGLSTYVSALFDENMPELAFSNFRAWAERFDGSLMFREQDGVIRAVLSESYTPYDSVKVIKNLRQTVDTDEYLLANTYVTSDRTHLRFISRNPLDASFDKSPLYSGFIVNSSDVGKASLSMKYFVYRQVCTNGMIATKHGGVLYRQYHIGDEMTASKIADFNKAMLNAHSLDSNYLEVAEKATKKKFSEYEFKVLLESIRKEAKLSQKGGEELLSLIDERYDRSKWGILNAVTEQAQKYALDTRIAMEELATSRLFA